jgi:chemotaxis protein MotA
MGGDLRMFYDVHADHRHFRRLVCGDADPLSRSARSCTVCRSAEVRLHDEQHRRRASSSTRSLDSGEIARKSGPVGLEKSRPEIRFLAKGVRFIADGYDADFIRDNLERDRDNFLTHLDEGSKIYPRIGDCAPAFGMIGTLIGMVQMFAEHDRPLQARPVDGDRAARDAATARWSRTCSACRSPTSCTSSWSTEEINRTLIIDGILMIRDSKSPTLVREMLLRYLPEKHRDHEANWRRPDAQHEGLSSHGEEKGGGHGGHGWFVTFAD